MTVSVTVKRRNLGVSFFCFKTEVVLQWYMHIEACCRPFFAGRLFFFVFFCQMASVRLGSLILAFEVRVEDNRHFILLSGS